MVEESPDIQTKFRSADISQSEIAIVCDLSRPTLNKHYKKYAAGELEKIPPVLLNLLQYAETHTAMELKAYFEDLRALKKKVTEVYDNKPFLINSKAPVLPSTMENMAILKAGSVLADGTTVPDMVSQDNAYTAFQIQASADVRQKVDKVMKTYLADHFTSDIFEYSEEDHAFVGKFDDAKLRSEKAEYYYRLMCLVSMTSAVFDDDVVFGSNIRQLMDLKEAYDKAAVAVSYVFTRGVMGGDAAIDKALDELNRLTFDPSKPKKLYLTAKVLSPIVDGYPDMLGYLDLVLVEAVSPQDAEGVGYLSVDVDQTAVHNVFVFGPFDNKSDGEKIKSYLEVEWENTFAEGLPVYTDAEDWLNEMVKKPALKGVQLH